MDKVYLIKEETLTNIIDPIKDITGNCGELTLSELTSDLDAANTLIETIAGKFINIDEIRYVQGTMRHLNYEVKSIGNYAFYYCEALTDVNLPNATSIGNYAFRYCKALPTIDLPNATSIGDYAFSDCYALTTVNLPLVTSIGDYAFGSCEVLTTVNLPNATSIGEWAFYECKAIPTIDLPNVTSIGDYAFRFCRALTALILRSETLCTLSHAVAFSSTPIASGFGYIYVPKALLEDYKAASNWSAYASQFRALEDYTVDGTTTGELDESKI